jgi:hypothetical protein
MNHWYTVDRIGAAHRADLDREAGRASLAAFAKRTGPTSRRTWASIVAVLLPGRRTRLGSAGAGQSIPGAYEIQVEVA